MTSFSINGVDDMRPEEKVRLEERILAILASVGEAVQKFWFADFRASEYNYAEHDGKTKSDYVEQFWRQFELLMYGTAEGKQKPRLFGAGSVRISDDSGFSKVPQLSSCPRATKGFYKLAMIFINIGIVTAQAYLVMNEDVPDASADRFLISKWIAKGILPDATYEKIGERDVNKLVSFIEVICVFVVFCGFIGYLILGTCSRSASLRRWSSIAYALWWLAPVLLSISALQPLYFVTPKVLSTDGSLLLLRLRQRYEANFWANKPTWRFLLLSVWPILRFTLQRILALVVGVDAFLVKFRLASIAINSTGDTSGADMLMAAVFLFQVMRIIDTDLLLRNRFFMFIFGGEDCILDIDEDALVEVWCSAITQQVFKEFGVREGTLIVLGFDDYDFQRLALNDEDY